MAREVQTTATLKAQTKGFVEAAQQAAKINQAASKAAKEQLRNTKEVKAELARMGSQLKDLARLQVSLNREMEKVEKGSKAYKMLSERMKEVNKQQSELQRSAGNVERAFREQGRAVTAAQMAKGGFVQGLLQGAAPGTATFLQRGPGMGRQAVGMGVGRFARNAASVPFSGIQGIAQALSNIPFVGGAVAAPLMLAAAQSGPALQYRQSLQEAMPYLGTAGLGGQMAEARRRAYGRLPESVINLRAKNIAASKTMREVGPNEYEMVGDYEQAYKTARRRLEAEREAMATAPRREAMSKIIGPGAELAGMEKTAAVQFAAQIARTSGGAAVKMRPEMFQTAFAARTLYGAGPETAGAFALAGRRGGLVGGLGKDAEKFAEAIGNATSLELEGSEVNEYLNIIAGGIQDWKRTGINMNQTSLHTIVRGFGATIGAVRGMNIAQGARGMGEGLLTRGPQDVVDMLMLKALGYRGGGAGDYERAMIKFEEQGGTPTGEQLAEIMKVLTAQGGRTYARQQLLSKGIRLGFGEMRDIETGGFKGFGAKEASQRVTSEMLAESAKAELDPVLARQAKIANDQINAGEGMLKSTQDLAETAAILAGTVSKELSPLMELFTGQILELTKALPALIERVKGATTENLATAYGKRLIDPFGYVFPYSGEGG